MAVSDNYLGQHADALGWIRLALRGPALWATAAALSIQGRPATALLTMRWLENQRQFFLRRGKEDARAETWMQRGARVSVAMLAVVTAGQLALHLRPWDLEPWTWTPLLMGILPAFAAFFVITSEGRAYEQHAHAYARGVLVFQQAKELALLAAEDATRWRELTLALGREALAENAAWLEGHRARPVASRTG